MPAQRPPSNILSGIPNPFLQDRVDSPWQAAFQDVPEINRTAFQSFQRSIQAVWQGNQSRGLLLHGEPGSGKTHLLQRVRFFTQSEPRTWFVYIPPFTSPGRFWRHLLERVFYDLCQRSKRPEFPLEAVPREGAPREGPGQGPLSQIEEAITRHLLERPLDSTRELGRWWARICQQDPPGRALFDRLKSTFDHLTVRLSLDPEVMKVLRHYLTWSQRSCAYTYLLGRDLPEEELAQLGVTRSLDDEERAKQAVLTFCRLAGSNFTIILSFDQIEGLQLSVEDLDGLRTFANGAVSLMSECQNLLILSAVLTSFLPTLQKAMHTSYYQRMAQDESSLTLLNRQTARLLIQQRLDACKELAELRAKDRRRGPLWPLTPERIDQLVPLGGLSSRELLKQARHLFDELLEAPPPRPKPVEQALSAYWREQFERAMQQPDILVDEGVYEDGLLKMLQAKTPAGWRVRRGTHRDLNAVMESSHEKVGISICHSENMTSLARKLERLQNLLDARTVDRLIFLRDARLPISTTATLTQQRLKKLAQSGSMVIRPPAEAYAALKVLRQLWNESAENNLLVDDSSVSLGQLQSWLAQKTPRPLQELIDACQEVLPAAVEGLEDRMLEILTGRWMMPLEEAAERLALTEPELSRWAMERPDLAGYLAGPPAVLFLVPEAASRS